MQQLQIYDVPSIIIYRDNYPRVYYGQRTGPSIFSFLNELITGDPIKLISHKQDKKQFSSEEQVKVVGYITKEGDVMESFKQAAKQFQGDISFALVQDPKIAKTFKLKSEGDILIDKPGERPIFSESAFTTRDDLLQWIHSNKKPLWATLTYTNIYSVWQSSKVTFVAFLNNLEEHQSKTVLAAFKSLAKEYAPENDISFVVVDTGVYKDFAQSLGLSEEDLPTFVIFDPFKRKEHYFPKDKTLNLKQSKRWLESYKNGKLDGPSTGGPTEDDSVVQLTTENFDSIVLDQEKDVLVEFFAPWCGHCQALAPDYRKVSSLMRLLPSVVVASVDTQAHQALSEKYKIEGLPTLLFFPSNNKENPLPLEDRAPISIVNFILDHQTSSKQADVDYLRQLMASLLQQTESGENIEEEGEEVELEEEHHEDL